MKNVTYKEKARKCQQSGNCRAIVVPKVSSPELKMQFDFSSFSYMGSTWTALPRLLLAVVPKNKPLENRKQIGSLPVQISAVLLLKRQKSNSPCLFPFGKVFKDPTLQGDSQCVSDYVIRLYMWRFSFWLGSLGGICGRWMGFCTCEKVLSIDLKMIA